jgi:hypothetical protein
MSEPAIQWTIVEAMAGAFVHRVMVQADGSFVLDVSRDKPRDQQIRLGCTFGIRDPDGALTEHDTERRETLTRALNLAGQTVASVRYSSSGELSVEFVDGTRLLAASDPRYENWEIAGGGSWIISRPGVGEEPADFSPRRSASD